MVTMTEKEAFAQRLNKALDTIGIPPKGAGRQTAAAKLFGLSQKGVRKWLEAEAMPETDKIPSIAKKLNVREEWLLFGRGQMTEQEELLKDKAFGNVRPAPMDIRRIPVISYVQAGNPKEVINDYAPGTGMAEIWTDLELGPDAFALIIEGDSMEPDFKAGDKVLIDPSVQPRAGQYVVAKCPGEEATFKRYRPRGRDQDGNEKYELVPLNDAYGPILSDSTHPCMIIGTMVEHRRYGR